MSARARTLVIPFLISTLLVAGCAKSNSDSSASSQASPGDAAAVVASSGPGAAAGAGAGATDASPAAVADAGDAVHGKALFATNCESCHGAAGAGGGIGPTLKGEKARKNPAAAVAWIKNPKPPMPKLYPSPLGEKDVSDVAAYVESL